MQVRHLANKIAFNVLEEKEKFRINYHQKTKHAYYDVHFWGQNSNMQNQNDVHRLFLLLRCVNEFLDLNLIILN